MNAQKARGVRLDWLMYLLAAAGLVGLIAWSTAKEIARNPARDAIADLGPYGLVTIRLTTSPFPPLPTGNVVLNFMPIDSRRRSVELDGIKYEYGMAGSDQPVGSGETQVMPGNGMYMLMGDARFPSVGDWWIRAKVRKGDAQAEIRFTVYIQPAQ